MSGPRDPTGVEQDLFKAAVESRDVLRLQSLVVDQLPSVAWGSVTKTLGEEDRKWVMENLTPEPPKDFGDL